MKRKQFTESQIVSALKRQEGGIAVKDIARDLGISEATVSTATLFLVFRISY
ncbi:MAG: transposase [Bacteroidetes bacterium]|nr:transposase [Bacteroidota bacterium]